MLMKSFSGFCWCKWFMFNKQWGFTTWTDLDKVPIQDKVSFNLSLEKYSGRKLPFPLTFQAEKINCRTCCIVYEPYSSRASCCFPARKNYINSNSSRHTSVELSLYTVLVIYSKLTPSESHRSDSTPVRRHSRNDSFISSIETLVLWEHSI